MKSSAMRLPCLMLALGFLALGCSPSGKDNSPPSLTIYSEPAGASVLIDETDLGKTPLTVALESVNDGSQIVLIMEDYHPEQVRIGLNNSDNEYTTSILFSGSSSFDADAVSMPNGLAQPVLSVKFVPLRENHPGSNDELTILEGRFYY